MGEMKPVLEREYVDIVIKKKRKKERKNKPFRIKKIRGN